MTTMEMLDVKISLQNLQANIPDGFVIDHIDGFIDEGGGVVITISLVEDGQSELVFLGVEEVVNAKHVEEVHFVTRIQGAVEVTFSELQISRTVKMLYVLVVNGEVVSIVERTHAVGDVVDSDTGVLEVDNHTDRLSEGKVFYTFTPNTYR